MLLSLALIFLMGLCLGGIFKKLKLPSLLGMILTGIILGPYVLNVLDVSILSISADLRQLALVIILTRAGLSLDIDALRKVGRPAVLMCFVPACFEIVGVAIFAPLFLRISLVEALILGTVLAAVSPAVIVPRMINLIENNKGTKKGIPQLIMAGASVDDIFVIVLFYSFVSIENGSGSGFSFVDLIKIPISILTGVLMGITLGFVLSWFFKKIRIRDSVKVLILLSVSFLLIYFESAVGTFVPFSGLLSIITLSACLLRKYKVVATRLAEKFSKLWVGAEILLFVLVGATVNIEFAISSGILPVLVIVLALAFRVVGVFVCLIKTNLGKKERLFCAFAYLPKATVQAAIGGIPLSMGLNCGALVLTTAVLSILITAPIGAILIDKTYKKLLD